MVKVKFNSNSEVTEINMYDKLLFGHYLERTNLFGPKNNRQYSEYIHLHVGLPLRGQ